MTGLNIQVYYVCFQFEVSDSTCNEVSLNPFISNTFINILLMLANVPLESQDDILLYIKNFIEYKYLSEFRFFPPLVLVTLTKIPFLNQ
mgnify:CR=1 FL=1